ncbi:alpha/beta hydrolase, partial [Pseudomonas aeruginosa]
IAGSGQPIDRVLREQLRGRLPPAQLRQADSVLASLKAGETRSDIPPALASLLRPSVQPYLISLFREDPARAFGRLRIPTLIVQGRNDIQVGVADAEALQRAKPDSQLVLIDGMNHILRIAPSTGLQQLSAYNDPNLPLARQLVEAVSRFILRGAEAEKGR